MSVGNGASEIAHSRITVVIHSLLGGGAERQISCLSNYLYRAGSHVTLITLDNHEKDVYPLERGIHRVRLGVMRPSKNKFDALRANSQRKRILRKAVKESNPQAIISFCDKTNILTLAACAGLKVPIVISERSDPQKQKLGLFWEAMRRLYYPRCTICVVQTDEVANYLAPMLKDRKKLVVIPSAIATDEVSSDQVPSVDSGWESNHKPESKASELVEDPLAPLPVEESDASSGEIPDTKPNDVLQQHFHRLLYVGRLSPEKGPDRLIQCWRGLARQFPDWKLVFVGDGELKEQLSWLVSSYRLTAQVEFLGWQTDMRAMWQTADAFVLSSNYEGFPNALLEALWNQIPSVTTFCSSSIRKIIRHEHNGLIAGNDEESLERNLGRLLNEPNLRKKFRENARASVAAFQWSTVSLQWFDAIGNALNNGIVDSEIDRAIDNQKTN